MLLRQDYVVFRKPEDLDSACDLLKCICNRVPASFSLIGAEGVGWLVLGEGGLEAED